VFTFPTGEELQEMKCSKTHVVCVCVFFLATISAYGQQQQRFNLGVDAGESSDKFGSQAADSGFIVNLNAQGIILFANPKNGGPDVLAGAEAILPADTGNHAKEYNVYGGVRWHVGNFSFGFDGGVRKILPPAAFIDNQYYNRDSMEFLEIPGTVRYNFWKNKRAFVQVQGAPEFGPRYHVPASSPLFSNPVLYEPNFDHAYFIRASAGYNFGKWYAKATYENRYFNFHNNANNPEGLYNWKTNAVTGGVGIIF
jgi:hypothetical protein